MANRVTAAHVLACAMAAISLSAAAGAQDGYKVIVNVANPIEALSKPEAARLFLTKTTWDTGEPVHSVNLDPSSKVRERFSRDVLGMSAASAMQQWKKSAGEPPPSMATDREVLAFVRLKRGAIGYVSAGANVQGVKVIALVKAQR